MNTAIRSLSEQQISIIRYLGEKEAFVSPTEIGKALGHDGSKWATPKCRKLVNFGLAIRNDKGQYKLNKDGVQILQMLTN